MANLLDDAFVRRLARIVPWVEKEMGTRQIQRPHRPQVVSPPERGILFKAVNQDVPAYGIISPYTTYGSFDPTNAAVDERWCMEMDAATDFTFSLGYENIYYQRALRRLFVNGPTDVAEGDYGYCYTAAERPRLALVKNQSQTTYEKTCGPAPGSFLLHGGLPGFLFLGPREEFETDTYRAWVMRDTQSGVFYAVATANWTDGGGNYSYVTCNPCCNGRGAVAGIYNGTNLLPNIDIQVRLPRNGLELDPNVESGDVICYRLGFDEGGAERGYFVACGSYLDRKIGAVEWRVEGAPGKGWGLMNGVDNAAGNGGSGKNLTDDIRWVRADDCVGIGTVSVHQGDQNVDLDYVRLKPYERLDNSA